MATDVAKGGQHAATIGDSTLHHKCEFDFSVALQNAVNQVDWLAAFEAEQELAGKCEQQPF